MTTQTQAGQALLPVPIKWLLAAWIVGSLLFAHGCHGPDEDHELFTSVVNWLAPE